MSKNIVLNKKKDSILQNWGKMNFTLKKIAGTVSRDFRPLCWLTKTLPGLHMNRLKQCRFFCFSKDIHWLHVQLLTSQRQGWPISLLLKNKNTIDNINKQFNLNTVRKLCVTVVIDYPRHNNDYADITMIMRTWQWLCGHDNDYADMTMIKRTRQWLYGHDNEYADMTMIKRTRQWVCRHDNEYTDIDREFWMPLTDMKVQMRLI